MYSKGVKSDDSRLSDRHIYSMLNSARSLLNYRKLRDNRKLTDNSYTKINCIELEEVSIIECPCVPVESCKVIRTKDKLDIFSYNGMPVIEWVYNSDYSLKFEPSSRNSYKASSGNKYVTSSAYKYIYENGYLYLYGKKLPKKYITARLVLNEVYQESICNKNLEDVENSDLCKSIYDYEFKIDEDLIDPVIDIVNKKVLSLFSVQIEDQTNNNEDTQVQTTK